MIGWLWSSPGLAVYLLLLAFVLGAVLGSFCNAWAWRLARDRSIVKGRSACAECGHPLSARDLVPLLSWLLLRGRCRYCGGRISPRYPAVELLSGLYFLSLALRFDPLREPFELLRWAVLGPILLVLSLVDFERYVIPDRLLVAGAVLFLLLTPVSGGLPALGIGLLGGVSVSVPLLALSLLADKLLKKESMGGGDIKLFAMLGLHLGPALTLLLLIVSCLIGIFFGLCSRRAAQAQTQGGSRLIPFGPAVCAGAWLTVLAGSPLLEWYLSLFP